jgi:hypothetical protein
MDFNGLAIPRLIRHADLEPLHMAAQKDNHLVIAPTHVVEKSGEIVGYLSMGVVPLIMTWQDTKKVNARDSVGLMAFMESVMASQRAGVICLPCVSTSPYHPYIEKFGYVKAGEASFFFKNLQQ